MSRVSLTPRAGTEATEVIVGLDHACGFFLQVYNAAGGYELPGSTSEGPEWIEGPFIDLDTGSPFSNATRGTLLEAIEKWAEPDAKTKAACFRIAGDLDPAL